MFRLIIAVLLMGLSLLSRAQNITAIEYFFDSDPGIDAGSKVTFDPASVITNLNFDVNITSLSDGFHTLFIRAKDANNQWSHTYSRPFYKLPAATFAAAPNITKIEYYIDTDPGSGAGIDVPITPNTTISNLVVNIDLADVTDGFHTLYFRTQDANGQWSHAYSRPFYKLPAATFTAAPNLNKLEYYIDTDPGSGAGIDVPITPNTTISNLVVNIDLADVTDGFHTLYFRTQDANGQWSHAYSRPFYKLPAATFTAAPNLNKLEYYIDTDPGSGAGTDVPIDANTSISNLVVNIDLTDVADGFHTLYFRTRDANGQWSHAYSRPFYKLPAATFTAAPNISKLEYYIDTDPGSGAGTDVPIDANTTVSNLVVNIDLTDVADGFHTLYFRTRDANGQWSHAYSRPFYKLPATGIASVPNLTKLEYFIDTDPGIEAGEVFTLPEANSINDFPIDVNVSGQSIGEHTLFIRAQDAKGNWSIVYASNFTMLGPEPTAQPTNLQFTNVQTTSMTLSWTAATGSPAGYIVLRSEGSAVEDIPKDGTTYTAGNSIGTSTVVFVGNGLTVNQTALSSGITYHYAVFAYNGSAELTNYRTADPLRNSQATSVIPPSSQPTNMVFSNVTTTSMTVGFTAASGAPAGYIGLVRAASSPTEIPQNGKTYVAGEEIGASKVAFVGSGTSFPVTGLSPGTLYFYDVFSYNGSGGSESYLTTNPLENNRTTLAAEPPAQPSNISFSTITANGFVVSFTAPAVAPTGYIAIRRIGSASTTDPVDGTTYTAGGDLGNGKIAYVGAAPTFTETGLNPLTQYFYKIYAFNGTTVSSNYLQAAPLSGNVTTAASPPVFSNNITPNNINAGSNLNVSVQITDNASGISSAKISYGSANSTSFAESGVDMLNPSGNTYTFTVPAAAFGESGLRYRIEASNGAGLSASVGPLLVSVNHTGNGFPIPYNSFGVELSNYRIISIPLNLTNKGVNQVFSTLAPYDDTRWRMFNYNASAQAYVELNGGSQIEIGRGYWFISKQNAALNTGGGRTVGTIDDPINIPIVRGRWNQIGNPYLFNVSWDDVVAANPDLTLGNLRVYTGGASMVNAPNNRLNAFEGGFVMIGPTGTSNNLIIPAVKNPAANGRFDNHTDDEKVISNSIESNHWEVRFKLQSANLINPYTGLGMHPQADEYFDRFDDFTMPRFLDYLELNHHKQLGKTSYSKDMVPTAESHSWTFDIVSSYDQEPVSLSWDNTYFNSAKKQLILFDEALQRSIDMSLQSSYTFHAPAKFRVLYGDAAYIKEQTNQYQLIFHPPYPNPATDHINISFVIPDHLPACEVSFELLDQTGRKTGIQHKGLYSSGFHTFTWKHDTELTKLTNGLYLIRLNCGELSLTRKILILR
jgi:hypothetical protein